MAAAVAKVGGRQQGGMTNLPAQSRAGIRRKFERHVFSRKLYNDAEHEETRSD